MEQGVWGGILSGTPRRKSRRKPKGSRDERAFWRLERTEAGGVRDPDYDGEVFRSVWQDYRGNTENDHDPFHVVRKAVLSGLPLKSGSRRVCVRVVDVFG
jgi:hypothetical protein